MRTYLPFLLFSILLFGFGGCIIVSDTLDYRNDLSDYEVKKIVRKIFVSRQTLTHAALIGNESFGQLSAYTAVPTERYTCGEQGYMTLRLQGDTLSFTLSAGDRLYLNYYACGFEMVWPGDGYSRLNGAVSITWNQYMYDSEGEVADFTIDFDRAVLTAPSGMERLDGRVGVHLERDYRRSMLGLILSSNRLVVENSRREEQTFTNVVLDLHTDRTTMRYRYRYSGTLYSDYLGRLTFSTPVTLEGYGDRNPAYGRLTISNEHVRLTVRPVDDYYVDIVLENYIYPSRNRIIHTTWINLWNLF